MLNLRGLRKPSDQCYQQNASTGHSTWLPQTHRRELWSIIGSIGGTLDYDDRGELEDEYGKVVAVHHETVATDAEREGRHILVAAYSSEVSRRRMQQFIK